MRLLETSTNSESETLAVAEQLAERLKAGDSVLLYGELGAGKTTFIRSLVSRFGPQVAVSSPTFALVNVYPTQPPIYHFDLYRLTSDADLYDLGFDESLESGGIVLVEWAEKCGKLQPRKYYAVSLRITGEQQRDITIDYLSDNDPGD